MNREPMYIVECKADGSAVAKRQVAGASVSNIPFDNVGTALDYANDKVREARRREYGLGR